MNSCRGPDILGNFQWQCCQVELAQPMVEFISGNHHHRLLHSPALGIYGWRITVTLIQHNKRVVMKVTRNSMPTPHHGGALGDPQWKLVSRHCNKGTFLDEHGRLTPPPNCPFLISAVHRRSISACPLPICAISANCHSQCSTLVFWHTFVYKNLRPYIIGTKLSYLTFLIWVCHKMWKGAHWFLDPPDYFISFKDKSMFKLN